MSSVEPLEAARQDRRVSDYGYPGQAQGEEHADVIDLRELLRVLRRRIELILGVTLAVAVLAVLIVSQLTSIYAAESMVLVGARESQVVDIEAVMAGLPTDAGTIESEIQVIRSRRLAGRVIDRLALDKDQEFNPALQVPSGLLGLLDPRTTLPDDWADWLTGAADQEPLDEAEAVLAQREAVIDTLAEALEVEAIGRSRVIAISAESESPKKAAAIANALAELYIVSQLEAKFEATERANAWLSDRLTTLRAQVEEAEQAVEAYRRETGIVEGERVNLTNEQISDLSTQLVLEQTKRAESEARLRQVQALLASAGGADSLSDVLSSRLIVSLREQEAEVKRKVAELSQEYGERHPRMVNARAELSDLEGKIEAEVSRIVEGLRNDVAVARARESSIRGSLNALKAQVGEVNADQVQLRALEREAEANRTLLQTFLARSKETENQGAFVEPDATIISSAAIPVDPAKPRKALLVILAVVVGGALGVGLAILVELIDQGIRSLGQAESHLGVPGLGLVPLLTSFGRRRRPELHLLEHPNSAYAESLRGLRTSLYLSDVERPPKTILVTSSMPGEGKTTIAVSLSYLVAHQGSRVVLVDCDLRLPTVHKTHDAPLSPGLTDVLNGAAELGSVIREDPASGTHIITAGDTVRDPAGLLTSRKMRELLQLLAERYDMVVLDSAPTLAVSETRALSRLSDKTVFLVRWAETPRDVAALGLRRLRDAGADVAGVMLTQVDMPLHARYGYGDSASYRRDVRRYYTT